MNVGRKSTVPAQELVGSPLTHKLSTTEPPSVAMSQESPPAEPDSSSALVESSISILERPLSMPPYPIAQSVPESLEQPVKEPPSQTKKTELAEPVFSEAVHEFDILTASSEKIPDLLQKTVEVELSTPASATSLGLVEEPQEQALEPKSLTSTAETSSEAASVPPGVPAVEPQALETPLERTKTAPLAESSTEQVETVAGPAESSVELDTLHVPDCDPIDLGSGSVLPDLNSVAITEAQETNPPTGQERQSDSGKSTIQFSSLYIIFFL